MEYSEFESSKNRIQHLASHIQETDEAIDALSKDAGLGGFDIENRVFGVRLTDDQDTQTSKLTFQRESATLEDFLSPFAVGSAEHGLAKAVYDRYCLRAPFREAVETLARELEATDNLVPYLNESDWLWIKEWIGYSEILKQGKLRGELPVLPKTYLDHFLRRCGGGTFTIVRHSALFDDVEFRSLWPKKLQGYGAKMESRIIRRGEVCELTRPVGVDTDPTDEEFLRGLSLVHRDQNRADG